MNNLYILALILAVASANTGVWVRWTSVSVPAFMRVKASGSERVMLEILNDGGSNIARDFPGNFVNAKAAKIKHVDVFAPLRMENPEQYCDNLATMLPESFEGIVWLLVQPGYLRFQNAFDGIPYVVDVVYYCKQHGIKTGILSYKEGWTKLFGSATAGSKVLSALPLWYLSTNGEANFNDFESEGFGTWKKPFMKMYELADKSGVDGIHINKSYYK